MLKFSMSLCFSRLHFLFYVVITVLMITLGLGSKTTQIGFGKDHVLAKNTCCGRQKYHWKLSRGVLKSILVCHA